MCQMWTTHNDLSSDDLNVLNGIRVARWVGGDDYCFPVRCSANRGAPALTTHHDRSKIPQLAR
eukprot:14984132-Heterocapsa_arctica.AAC.1